MELIAVSPAGRQIIERYAASGFRVSGVIYQGPVLVFPDRTLSWPEAVLTPESLAPVIEHGGVELLLLGLGRRMVQVAADLRAWLKTRGIALEPMVPARLAAPITSCWPRTAGSPPPCCRRYNVSGEKALLARLCLYKRQKEAA
jgi:uncharacterized protein